MDVSPIAFVRLNRVLVRRDANRHKSDKSTVIRPGAQAFLELLVHWGYKIIIYTNMETRHAQLILGMLVRGYPSLKSGILGVLDKNQLCSSGGKFCVNAALYVSIARSVYTIRQRIESCIFVDCEKLDNLQSGRDSMIIVPEFHGESTDPPIIGFPPDS